MNYKKSMVTCLVTSGSTSRIGPRWVATYLSRGALTTLEDEQTNVSGPFGIVDSEPGKCIGLGTTGDVIHTTSSIIRIMAVCAGLCSLNCSGADPNSSGAEGTGLDSFGASDSAGASSSTSSLGTGSSSTSTWNSASTSCSISGSTSGSGSMVSGVLPALDSNGVPPLGTAFLTINGAIIYVGPSEAVNDIGGPTVGFYVPFGGQVLSHDLTMWFPGEVGVYRLDANADVGGMYDDFTDLAQVTADGTGQLTYACPLPLNSGSCPDETCQTADSGTKPLCDLSVTVVTVDTSTGSSSGTFKGTLVVQQDPAHIAPGPTIEVSGGFNAPPIPARRVKK
jgi:hypothetical protein